MIVSFILHLVITAALLLVVAHLVKGVEVDNWGAAFVGALVLGLANAFVKPLMVLLTLPITVLTFGLFLLAVNALVLQMVAALTPGVRVRGFGAALLGSLLLTVLNLAVEMLIGPEITVMAV